MLKYAGIALLIMSAAMAGNYASCRKKKRLTLLRAFRSAIVCVKTQLEYRCPPIEAILLSLVRTSEHPFDEIAAACLQDMENGTDFPGAWKSAVLRLGGLTELDSDDLGAICALAEIVGSCDLDGQINNLAISEATVLERIKEAQSENEKRGRLFTSIGALSGLMLGIILL